MSRWAFSLDKKKNPVSFTTQGFIYISLTKTSYVGYYAVANVMLHSDSKKFKKFEISNISVYLSTLITSIRADSLTLVYRWARCFNFRC